MGDVNSARRSRRAVLQALVGGVAGTVVAAVAGPGQARAGNDGDVVLGAANEASSVTSIKNTTPGGSGEAEIGGLDTGVRGTGHLGVEGYSEDGAGIVGSTKFGAGVSASAPLEHAWTRALVAEGRVRLSRSGRVTIPAGKQSFDVDFRSSHGTYLGLEGRPLCFANLMSYRPGVWVTTMRPNYPIPGKARIYLNVAPSSATYVAWVVLDS